MSLVVFKFSCANCGREFEAPETSGDYGEFVMRGEFAPEPALLVAPEDPVYIEVDRILEGIGAYRNKSEAQIADLLQRVFVVACDPAPDGTLPCIGRRPRCPTCGSGKQASWEPTHPPRAYTGATFAVTHQAWIQLTADEKENAIGMAFQAIASKA